MFWALKLSFGGNILALLATFSKTGEKIFINFLVTLVSKFNTIPWQSPLIMDFCNKIDCLSLVNFSSLVKQIPDKKVSNVDT